MCCISASTSNLIKIIKMTEGNGRTGGFVEQFVSTPLDRYFCVICQHPSRDPRLSVCCGHVFCKSCVDKVKHPCPTCQDKRFVTFPNKQLDHENWMFSVLMLKGIVGGKVSLVKLVIILENVSLRR